MNKVFRHAADNYDGLFKYLRNKNLISSVGFFGPRSYSGGYCTQGTIAADLPGIVDGNILTAWANMDNTIPTMYFIINFVTSKFRLNGISVHTRCYRANNFMVLGSNDGIEYHSIVNITNLVNLDTVFNDFSLKPAYRYFKFTQDYIKESPSYHRFHVSELEFFGILIQEANNNTCKCRKTTYSLLLMINILLSIK